MKITIHDLLNAAGLGFQFTLAETIVELLNASHGESPERALECAKRLRTYRDRPAAPMPLEVLGALVSQLGGKVEPKYAALVVTIWAREWNPSTFEDAIRGIGAVGLGGERRGR